MADRAGHRVLLSLVLALLSSHSQSQSYDCNEYKETLCTGKPLLKVAYKGKELTCDRVYTMGETAMPPVLEFPGAVEGTKYLLFMTDPDAPRPCDEPHDESWLHYIAVLTQRGSALEVNPLKQYEGPGPPPGSGAHRYQFRLFKPATDPPDQLRGVPSEGFKLQEVKNQYNLGEPLAQFQFKVSAPNGVPGGGVPGGGVPDGGVPGGGGSSESPPPVASFSS